MPDTELSIELPLIITRIHSRDVTHWGLLIVLMGGGCPKLTLSVGGL